MIVAGCGSNTQNKHFQQDIVNATSPQRIISFGDNGRYLVLPDCDVAKVKFKGSENKQHRFQTDVAVADIPELKHAFATTHDHT